MSEINLSPKEIDFIYELYKIVPPGSISEFMVHLKEKQQIDLTESFGNISESDWSLCHKVANQCSKDEFIELVEQGEFPAVKLTTEEMEHLKAGSFFGALVEAWKGGIEIISEAIDGDAEGAFNAGINAVMNTANEIL